MPGLELNNKQVEIYDRALAKYGKNGQMLIALEEMSELTKELVKNMRGRDNIAEITEELADVYVTLEHIKRIIGIADAAVYKIAHEKIDRLEQRLIAAGG